MITQFPNIDDGQSNVSSYATQSPPWLGGGGGHSPPVTDVVYPAMWTATADEVLNNSYEVSANMYPCCYTDEDGVLCWEDEFCVYKTRDKKTWTKAVDKRGKGMKGNFIWEGDAFRT